MAGNGQVELAEAVSGVRALHSGAVDVDGESLGGRPTAVWLESGVAYVPEDRHRDGILPSASIMENLVLGAQRSVRFRRVRSWTGARPVATRRRPSGPTAVGVGALRPAAELSGGNMQRVILARAFSHRPGFLILHNPPWPRHPLHPVRLRPSARQRRSTPPCC